MEEATLFGKWVVLRPATLEDRRAVYEWAVHSDITQAMMGPPTFPEKPAPTWREFCDDYQPHFFDGSALELGRCYIILAEGGAVGQVNYNDIEELEGRRRTELDLWMRAERYCGKGYGSDALATLCEHLVGNLGVREFMMQPSARNPRAIRAYQKIGFVPLNLSPEEAQAQWGPSDYYDSVYMVKTVSEE